MIYDGHYGCLYSSGPNFFAAPAAFLPQSNSSAHFCVQTSSKQLLRQLLSDCESFFPFLFFSFPRTPVPSRFVWMCVCVFFFKMVRLGAAFFISIGLAHLRKGIIMAPLLSANRRENTLTSQLVQSDLPLYQRGRQETRSLELFFIAPFACCGRV